MSYHSVRRTEKKRNTRQALIEGALRLFLEHGTEAPSLEAICRAAGCTRGAFHVHFESREELTIAAMEQGLSRFINEVLASNAATDAAGFVDAFLDAIASGRHETGSASLAFRHVLDACARYRGVRDRYLLILDATAASLATRLTERSTADARARSQLLVLIALGLLASVDLDRPLDLSPLRPLIRDLAGAPPASA